MRVFIYTTGQDTGGQGHRIHDAFARYTDWTVDSVNASRSSLGYPEQYELGLRDRLALIKRLYAGANVVHLRNNLSGWNAFDQGRGIPTIVHHHGTQFREGHGGLAAQARAIDAVQVAATLDLTLLEPNVEWVPSPYNLHSLAAMRVPAPSGIRIAHFPTSARIKSTEVFLAATERLAERYPIEVVTNVRNGHIRHMQWSEVLEAKATADIYFDQVILGYGNNAIEAWGMGIPVVAGVEDPRTRALMLERFGELPFVDADEASLESALERLIQSAQMRAEYAERGLAHVQRFHDDAKVTVQLQGIYRNAPPTRVVVLPRAQPGWLLRKQAEKARRQERMDIRERLRAARVA